jgi:hypothetical protein
MIICSKCGCKNKYFKKEIAGWILFLFALFFYWLGGMITPLLILIIPGTYWIVTRPSKKYICQSCLSKIKLDQ